MAVNVTGGSSGPGRDPPCGLRGGSHPTLVPGRPVASPGGTAAYTPPRGPASLHQSTGIPHAREGIRCNWCTRYRRADMSRTFRTTRRPGGSVRRRPMGRAVPPTRGLRRPLPPSGRVVLGRAANWSSTAHHGPNSRGAGTSSSSPGQRSSASCTPGAARGRCPHSAFPRVGAASVVPSAIKGDQFGLGDRMRLGRTDGAAGIMATSASRCGRGDRRFAPRARRASPRRTSRPAPSPYF